MDGFSQKLGWFFCVALSFLLSPLQADEANAKPLRILFLGDNGPHRPAERAALLAPVMAQRGIVIQYTDDLDVLQPNTLAAFDGLLIYANVDRISEAQERALLDFVAGGKGLIPLHCASFCFRNSPTYVKLVGAQFQRHGAQVFGTKIVQPEHPILRGFGGFRSFDESYVHHQHNTENRTVLSYRTEGPQADGQTQEPWTWIRTHGKGRVFYTAWGHDQRTWGHPGFQNLIERGIRWAVRADPGVVAAYAEDTTAPNANRNPFPVPQTTALPKNLKPFEYQPAKVAFYSPDGKRRGDGEWNQMQRPLSPEESQKHFVTPVGFRVELFAAEPDIGKPICMAWDERGRLWIAETVDYPNDKQPEGQGRDRIRILEDTDHDGRADRFTTFAENLSIPTSLAFSHGGVIVHQAPETLFLKDTNGDDQADERRPLITGWGTSDTHAGPSNLQWGLDNQLYGTVGYAGFRGRVGGESHTFGQGIYRFTPDGKQLEFLRSTNNNTWGLSLSEEGIVFVSTANRNPSDYLPLANRYYEQVRGWSAARLDGIADTHLFQAITNMVRQVDHHGGYTAAAGHALYTARSYPQEYWNRAAFVCEPTGHLVGTFVLEADGAGFRSRNPFNLLASDDEWAAPIMAEVGPDGQVWVIDWYNYIVQHNPTPVGFENGPGNAYVTPLRDKTHGRIYRLVYGADKPSTFSLAKASPQTLAKTLAHDNRLWRMHAQRLLVERGQTDVVPALAELVKDQSVDAIGLNAGAMHALWTLHGLKAIDLSDETLVVAVSALRHPSAGVRRNAVLVLPRSSSSAKAILDAKLLTDRNAQVRLAALRAIADQPSNSKAGEAVAAMLLTVPNQSDPWIRDAATSAAANNALPFLQALASRKIPIPGAVREVAAIIAEHVARGEPGDEINPLLLDLAEANPAFSAAVITGLANGWPKGHEIKLSPEAETALTRQLDTLPMEAQGQLLKLATALGSKLLEAQAETIIQALLKTVGDPDAAELARVNAARQLIAFRARDEKLVAQCLDQVTPQATPAFVNGLLEALSQSQAANLGTAVIERIPRLTPATKPAAIRLLLSRADATRALLDGLAARNVPLSDLTLDQQQSLAAHPDRRLRERAKLLLASGGGLPNPDRQKVLADFMSLTEETGDPGLGKDVFKKQCAKCHRHREEGTNVGPDLTGQAVHSKAELLTHVLDPSRSVEGTYRAYSVATTDGRVLSGLLASETKTSIELIDTEAKRQTILREDIEELIASSKSVMPEGFEKQLSRDDVRNLLEFLKQRGQFLPLDLRNAATIVSTRGMFHGKEADAERLIFSDWSPKTFEGVPFHLVDPQGDRVPNVVMLYGPNGTFPPKMPKSVSLPVRSPAKAVHLLSGVGGWSAKQPQKEGTVSMIVRLHYQDGGTEDHALYNGRHFADYIGPFDVPESKLAFRLRGQQIRYLAIRPKETKEIVKLELVKGQDSTAPIVMAVTIETTEPSH